MNEKANIKEALSLLESALNILRDGVIPKDGEEDTVDDWIEDYGEFLRHNDLLSDAANGPHTLP